MTPKLSFGLPVRNGGEQMVRAIESILAQTYSDFELVISDNVSTDDTVEVCRSYAARDPRVRVFVNEKNIGVDPNYNRLVELARGEYFRWLGADDWLEPSYAERCVAVLDARPECIAVGTHQAFWDEHGNRMYQPYTGPWVESSDPVRRYARMLWFLRKDFRFLDPDYSLIRREVLARTHMQRVMVRGDFTLAAELALAGPIAHVEECLANRNRPAETLAEAAAKCRPPDWEGRFAHSDWELVRVLLADLREADLTTGQRLRCSALAIAGVSKEALTERLYGARQGLGRLARSLGIPVDRLKRATRTPAHR